MKNESNEINHAEREHAKYSPSGMAYIATCPGFSNKEKKLEEGEFPDDFDPAVVGTRIHEALEKEDPCDLLSDHELTLYTRGLQNLKEIEIDLCACWGCQPEELEVLKEVRLGPITLGQIPDELYGTVDVLIRYAEHAAIVDYKTGQIEVEAPARNLQMMTYSLLVFKQFEEVETVSSFINQPSIFDGVSSGVMYRSEDYRSKFSSMGDPHELPLFEEAEEIVTSIIYAKVRDANNPYAYRSSFAVCPYCERLATCQKVTRLATLFSKKVFHDEDMEEVDLESDEGINQLMEEPKKIINLLDFSKVLIPWVDSLKETAKTLLNNGIDLSPYKLGSGGTTIGKNNSSFISAVRSELDDTDIVDALTSLPVTKFLEKILVKRLKEEQDLEWEDSKKMKKDPIFAKYKQKVLDEYFADGIFTSFTPVQKLLRGK